MRERGVRVAVVVVDAFVALSAIVGAVGLLVGFMQIPLSVLNGAPFTNFTIPALLLGIVVGGSALAAAVIAWLGLRRFDTAASAAAGCIMMGWMTVEVAMIGLVSWAQAAYFLVGLLMVGLAGLLRWSRSRQISVTAWPHTA